MLICVYIITVILLQYISRRKNMATAQTNGSGVTSTSTVNNGGVVVNAGTGSTNVSRLALGGSDLVSGVVATDDVTKALTSGTLAFNHSDPIAIRLTDTINGSSNTAILYGATKTSERARVHRILVRDGAFALVSGIRTRLQSTSFRDGDYNVYTGQFSSAPAISVDEFNDDTSVDGSLTYKGGSANPEVVSYTDLA